MDTQGSFNQKQKALTWSVCDWRRYRQGQKAGPSLSLKVNPGRTRMVFQKRKNTAIRHLASTQSWWAEDSTMVLAGGYCVSSWRHEGERFLWGWRDSGEKTGRQRIFCDATIAAVSPGVLHMEQRKQWDADWSFNNFLLSLASEYCC